MLDFLLSSKRCAPQGLSEATGSMVAKWEKNEPDASQVPSQRASTQGATVSEQHAKSSRHQLRDCGFPQTTILLLHSRRCRRLLFRKRQPPQTAAFHRKAT